MARTSWHNVPISQDVETNEPSRRRSTSSENTRRLHYPKSYRAGNVFTDGLPIVPVSTSKDVVIFVLAQPTHKSHLKNPLKEPTLTTHLLQTVDDKPVSFHNGSNLRRQRAQQLTPLLLFTRISQGERGNEINMGVRVRFAFVEPQMDHVWIQSRARRVKARLAGAKEAAKECVSEPQRRDGYGSGGAEPRHVFRFRSLNLI